MGSCEKCGGCGTCGESRAPAPPPGGGDVPPGALYVFQTSIKVVAGQPETQLFTLPPAAAVDVFIQYRDPSTGSNIDPSQAVRFSIYATQRLLSYLVDRNSTANVSTTNRRILAVRDLPVDRYEVRYDGTVLVDANGAFYDVVAIGWGKEPTGIGPRPVTEWVDGADVPGAGRNVGFPLMAVNDGDQISILHATDTNLHSAPMDLNTMPVSQFLTAPPTRTNGQLGPFMCDASGNLLVALSSGGGTPASSRFVSSAYEASHARAGAATLRSAYVSSKAAAAGFVFIFDAAALPANGTVPDFPPIPIPAGGFVSVEIAEGRPMTNGIVLAFSSTQATLTLSTADCWFEGHF